MLTLYARARRWARMDPVVRHLPVVKFLVLALFYRDRPQLAQRCGTTLRYDLQADARENPDVPVRKGL
ncbi:MAG: hypothetical protein JWP41_50 [Ramlibacter sp.]|nr:hypothetical protein [Ramlibacter sp.]